jgi:hypothetical protein
MGSSGNPSLLAELIGLVCFAPWVYLIFSAIRDKSPEKQQQPYREIQPRDLSTEDDRAGFVQAKLEKIERASR